MGLYGNLNAVLDPLEKEGGRPCTEVDSRFLRNFMENTGGVNLGFVGNRFTLTNKNSVGGSLIRERLYRVVSNLFAASTFLIRGC